MFEALGSRSTREEYMDDFDEGGRELEEALRHLRLLNRIFAASGPLLYGVKELWKRSGCPKELHIMDIGAGSGEMNRRILRWANRKGIRVRITLVDMTEEACREANQIFASEPRVRTIRQDVFDIGEEAADMLICSQFLHHFPDERLAVVTGHMLKAARLGVVICDIHRHWIAWSAVWLVARIISRNRYIRHDAPLSVAKGFQSKDWDGLTEDIKQNGNYDLRYRWQPLFRYTVVISNKET